VGRGKEVFAVWINPVPFSSISALPLKIKVRALLARQTLRGS